MKTVMFCIAKGLTLVGVLSLALAIVLYGQETKPAPPSPRGSASASTEPTTTLKVTTHMVTVQVVAHDAKGHHVPGLTAKDFQVFEQVYPRKDQHPQQVKVFQAVSMAALAAADKGRIEMPPGVYSNLVTMQKVPVPPTILLVDGLNTNVSSQMQVHRQMVKLLASLPTDVPVAVFLMGRNLHLLQNFTTDTKLLRAAVLKALSLDRNDLSPVDMRGDRNALATLVADLPRRPPQLAGSHIAPDMLQDHAVSAQLQFLQDFERETFSTQTTMRVQATLDAFRSIARHVAGYPGRKNLLWISSSFPLALFPDSDFKFVGMEDYQDQFSALGRILSDAKIAIYPMDASGLQAQSFYEASAHPTSRNVAIGTATGVTVMREESSRSASQESMTQLASQTGGRVCVNNNDLADCVKKAVDDGSSYYELAYYPDSGDWKGEFHRIIVKAVQGGTHLTYREGYFARTEGGSVDDKEFGKQVQRELQDATCHDLLTSTTILVMAEAVPADQPGQVKYFLAIDPRLLSFEPSGEGRSLSLTIAACSFDKDGKPLQYLQQSTDMKMSEQQFVAFLAQHGFPRTFSFAPSAGAVRIRLVVRDTVSGQVGSIDVPYASAAVDATVPSVPPVASTTVPASPK